MDANKHYITQLTAQDLNELAALTKLDAGEGLTITKENGRIVIAIDRDKLRALLGVIY